MAELEGKELKDKLIKKGIKYSGYKSWRLLDPRTTCPHELTLNHKVNNKMFSDRNNLPSSGKESEIHKVRPRSFKTNVIKHS